MKKKFLVTLFLISAELFPVLQCESRMHIFGDSNALYSFTKTSLWFPGQKTFRFEEILVYEDFAVPLVINAFVGKTMHGISKDGFLNIKEFGVEENEVVVFVFGCVDVYYHIATQRDDKNRELNEILDSLVDNYVRCIVKNRAQYDQQPTCIIVSVLPPHNEIPGSLEDKVDITIRLNEKLRQSCSKCGIEYLDIYHYYATEQGFLDPALSSGHHVASAYNCQIRKNLVELYFQKRPSATFQESIPCVDEHRFLAVRVGQRNWSP